VLASFLLAPYLGRNFFPMVDAGQILMHVRTQVGTRIEDSANQFARIQAAIRQIIPPAELGTMVDNIGIPVSGINMAYNNTGTIGPQDGDIQIKLKDGHGPTADYMRALREELPERFPGTTFSFLPADIIGQILNFGAPAPIDLQIRGPNLAANFTYANELLGQLRHIPGIADVRIQQSPRNPGFNIDVDRTRAQYVGVTERDVTNSLVVNLAGSSQVAPTYWLNPTNGVSYPIVLQTPQYQVDSLSALENLPITAAGAASPQILGGIADISRAATNAVVSQYNIQPLIQIYATTQGRDLGAVAADIQKVVDAAKADVPKGSSVALIGQVQTMNAAFGGLLFGLLGAIVLVYLLIVVNFQSWSDPFVIITALPAALVGIVWMLFATNTTLSVPALTGAIMCMGVATANSVLVISFARERLAARRPGGRRAGGGLRALPPRAHDRTGDDHWHGAHGARTRWRRRAERPARPRRHRRPRIRDGGDADVRARRLQHAARARQQAARAHHRRTACRLRIVPPSCRAAPSATPAPRRPPLRRSSSSPVSQRGRPAMPSCMLGPRRRPFPPWPWCLRMLRASQRR
jgi:multidrug efflux pump subunit AcrB